MLNTNDVTSSGVVKRVIPWRKAAFWTCLAVIGLTIRLYTYSSYKPYVGLGFQELKVRLRNDVTRYVDQAQNLANGRGFLTFGTLTFGLPPGYPLVIALLIWAKGNATHLVLLNFVLTILPALLFVMVARSTGDKRWYAASILLVIAPCSYSNSLQLLVSEPLGHALVGVAIVALHYVARAPSLVWLAGACVGLSLLTTPHMQIVWPAPLLGWAWYYRKRVKIILCLFASTMIILLPWYSYKAYKMREFSIALYQWQVAMWDIGYHRWVRTWAVFTSELMRAHHVPDFKEQSWLYFGHDQLAPEETRRRVLSYREEFLRVVHSQQGGTFQYLVDSRGVPLHRANADLALGDDFLQELAQQRTTRWPWLCHVVLPFLRGIATWTEFRNIFWEEDYRWRVGFNALVADWHNYGGEKALKRYVKGWVTSGVVLLNAAYGLILLLCIFRSIRRKDSVAMGLCLGVLLYTAAGAWLCVHEYRRNYVLYPCIMYAWAKLREPLHKSPVLYGTF